MCHCSIVRSSSVTLHSIVTLHTVVTLHSRDSGGVSTGLSCAGWLNITDCTNKPLSVNNTELNRKSLWMEATDRGLDLLM